MRKQLSPETADPANISAWLEMQEAKITRLEREMGAVHGVVAVLKRQLDPHEQRADVRRD